VAHALLTLGAAEITIIDTDEVRSQDLAAALCDRFGERRASARIDLADAMAAADGMVNTTPLGMAKYPGMAVPAELLRPDLWVADIVYFPLETELLRQARARGCRIMSGGGMAVFQAVGAFRLFTGLEPSAERMLRHFNEM
jgi:shikimate dehydrogenase